MEASRREIDSAATFKGVVVRDAGEVKNEFKGEVVAMSSHHALVKVSELIAIRVEKSPSNQDLQMGDKLSVQQDGNKAQVYQRSKQPSRNRAQDAARDLGR